MPAAADAASSAPPKIISRNGQDGPPSPGIPPVAGTAAGTTVCVGDAICPAAPVCAGEGVGLALGVGVAWVAGATLTRPCMAGWKLQWYSNDPTVLNVCENVLGLARLPELNPPAGGQVVNEASHCVTV